MSCFASALTCGGRPRDEHEDEDEREGTYIVVVCYICKSIFEQLNIPTKSRFKSSTPTYACKSCKIICKRRLEQHYEQQKFDRGMSYLIEFRKNGFIKNNLNYTITSRDVRNYFYENITVWYMLDARFNLDVLAATHRSLVIDIHMFIYKIYTTLINIKLYNEDRELWEKSSALYSGDDITIDKVLDYLNNELLQPKHLTVLNYIKHYMIIEEIMENRLSSQPELRAKQVKITLV